MPAPHDGNSEGAPARGKDGRKRRDKRERATPSYEVPHFFPHLEPLRERYVKIPWSDSVGRSTTTRIRAQTCPCTKTTFELCAVGGLLHIRRIVTTPNGDLVSESPWLRWPNGKALWRDLLGGRAY
ncbi:hypothetical protein ACWEPC_11485 [Nonomuraea sp. NPDC004297]